MNIKLNKEMNYIYDYKSNLSTYPKAVLCKMKYYFITILRRYLRLIFIVFFCIFILTYILPYIAEGAVYNILSKLNSQCNSKYFFSNILFIGNIYYTAFPSEYTCASHMWILALDMQYYIVFSFIIVVFFKQKKIRYFLYLVAVIASIIIQMNIIKKYDLKYANYSSMPGLMTVKPYMEQYETHTTCRVSTFILGLIFSEMYYYGNLTEKISRSMNNMGINSSSNNISNISNITSSNSRENYYRMVFKKELNIKYDNKNNHTNEYNSSRLSISDSNLSSHLSNF